MHKPTLIKTLRFAKSFAPEDPQLTRALIQHIVKRSVAQDPTLDVAKLLAGAGITE